jgi:hypothetical protein
LRKRWLIYSGIQALLVIFLPDEPAAFYSAYFLSLMIVPNPNFPGIVLIPFETNPPLHVDADAILALSVSFQSIKAI